MKLERFHPDLNRIKYLIYAKNILPIEKCVLIGSAFLTLVGLHKNNDLDLVVPVDVYNKSDLVENDRNIKQSRWHEVEIGTKYCNLSCDQLMEDAICFQGVNFISIEKQYYIYKNILKRPKDLDKCMIYEAYLL